MSKVEWCPEPVEGQFVMIHGYKTYILQCSDGSYYVGHAKDLEERIDAHNIGRGAKYTYLRRPVRLVYSEHHDSKEDAVRRECQIKRWSRAKKEALMSGDMEALTKLSKSKD